MKVFAVALYFEKPWVEGKHELPEHITMNIVSGHSWLDAMVIAMKIHEDKGTHKWHSISEVESVKDESRQQEIDQLVAGLEEIKQDLKAPLQLEMPFEKAVRSALRRTEIALAKYREARDAKTI